jgi:hypothetical protein
MKYVITIEMTNDAYQDANAPYEIAGTLSQLAREMTGTYCVVVGAIQDTNGNTVGEARVED